VAVYSVTINQKYRYTKVYRIVKPIGKSENALSKAFASLVDKLVSKKQQSA